MNQSYLVQRIYESAVLAPASVHFLATIRTGNCPVRSLYFDGLFQYHDNPPLEIDYYYSLQVWHESGKGRMDKPP